MLPADVADEFAPPPEDAAAETAVPAADVADEFAASSEDAAAVSAAAAAVVAAADVADEFAASPEEAAAAAHGSSMLLLLRGDGCAIAGARNSRASSFSATCSLIER
jgi:hypothetical protein